MLTLDARVRNEPMSGLVQLNAYKYVYFKMFET